MDVVALLAGVIAMVLLGLALLIAGDRVRLGLRRADNEKLGRKQRQTELAARLEQLRRAIEEQATAIQAAERELTRAQEENDRLRAALDKTEHVFNYTAVPLESRDMYARVWRFTARHPVLGANLPAFDPAAQWNQGRLYAVAAANKAEARSAVDRLLPRQRGFVVVNAGEAPTAPQAASPAEPTA